MPDQDGTPHILHFITRWLRGGAEAKTLAELEGLSHRYRFTLVHGAEAEQAMLDRVHALSIETHQIDALRHYDALRMPAAVRAFRAVVEAEAPDLVHVHSTEAGAVGRWALRKMDVPVVFTLHGLPFGPQRAAPLRFGVRWIERRLGRHTTRFAANADALTETYLEHGIGKPEQFTTIYSGVDLDEIMGAPAAELPGQPPRVLFAGRLAEGKGARRLVEALRALREQGTEASLIVAGEGPLLGEIEAMAPPWLHTLGYREDLPSVMKACDVLALPSDHEGTPRVITEAMACGLPVVASRVGGIPEQVVDGESGLLVDPHDQQALLEALDRLLDDRELANTMAKRASDRVDRFSVANMLEATDALYREILD